MEFIFFLLLMICVSITSYFLVNRVILYFNKYKINLKNKAEIQFTEAFIFLDPFQLWTLSLALATFVLLIVFLFSQSYISAIILAIFFLLLPHFLLKRLKKKRLIQFDQQLPDFLLALAGALNAGSGIQNAIRFLEKETIAPLSQELSLVTRQQRMGMSFEDSLDQLSKRMPSEACYLIVSVLKIGYRSGGNLSDAIERIAMTIRTRLQIQGRINALTSQGKMQAWVMCLLPLGLMFILNHLDPDAMSYLWNSFYGFAVLLLVFILELIGIYLIKKIVNIDI